jgi:phosphopantothenate---cysteine ligase (CTP)
MSQKALRRTVVIAIFASPSRMRVIVTTGPSYEPIDQVRRLTNFSTGELGVRLASELAKAGCEVTCLRGVSATYRGSCEGATELPFTTNDDLLAQLRHFSQSTTIDAVFQVAALCDFKVARVDDASGAAVAAAKLDSRVNSLTIHLVPACKLISELRGLFPKATIVGWKYELVGSREEALAKAWRQIGENRTDACVLNGAAWGDGFGFCTPPARVETLAGKAELAQFLPEWLRNHRRAR